MEREELLDLAALSALSALEDPQASELQQQLAHSPELAQELAGFQMAVAALVYGGELIPMADLKQRLLQRIACDSLAAAQPDWPSVEQLLQQAETVSWQPYVPVSGIFLATLTIDPSQRQITCFVRADALTRFPLHLHASHEEIVVLQGDLVIDGQVYGRGDRIVSPPGTTHRPETRQGCLLFLQTSLDDQVLG
jgi:hypothetical protein